MESAAVTKTPTQMMEKTIVREPAGKVALRDCFRTGKKKLEP